MASGNGDPTIVTQSMLQEAVDAILIGIESMFKEERKERKKEIQEVRNGLKQEISEVKNQINSVSDQIENLDEKVDANYKNTNGKVKAMKVTSVSRAEFEELREEVHRLKKSFASA